MKISINKFQGLVIAGSVAVLLMFVVLTRIDLVLAVGLLAAFVLFLLFWYDIRIGLWLSIFSILGGQILRISLTSGGILLSDAVIGVLVVVWLFNILYRRYHMKWNIVWISLLIFWVAGFVINWLAQPRLILDQATTMWLYWFRLFLYSMYLPVVWHITSWYHESRRYLRWWMLMGLVFLVLGFGQLIFVPDISWLATEGWDPHIGRLLSTFLDPNFAGAILVLFFGVSFAFYFRYKEWNRIKIFWLIVSGLLALGVGLTLSRSAYLGLAAVYFILAFLFDKRWILIGLLVGTIFLFGNERIYQRIEGIVTIDETAQFRIDSWRDTWEIVEDNYWTGVGYNALAFENFRRGYFIDLREHNAAGSDSTLLTIWATMGWVGVMAFMLIFVTFSAYSIWIFFKDKFDWQLRFLAIGLAVGVVGVFIHSQFTNSLLYAHILLPIFYGMGLVLGWAEEEANKVVVKG